VTVENRFIQAFQKGIVQDRATYCGIVECFRDVGELNRAVTDCLEHIALTSGHVCRGGLLGSPFEGFGGGDELF
jgi:hypothetical protein